jgi:hypothetical protein
MEAARYQLIDMVSGTFYSRKSVKDLYLHPASEPILAGLPAAQRDAMELLGLLPKKIYQPDKEPVSKRAESIKGGSA